MRFSQDQIDALTEVVNIGVGRAAGSLCSLIDRHIELHVPQVELVPAGEMNARSETLQTALDTSVIQDFDGVVNGRAVLAFPRASGVLLAQILGEMEEEQDELDLDLAGVLEEIGNIVLNGVLGTMANLFRGEFLYTVPRLESDMDALHLVLEHSSARESSEPAILVADAHFSVAESDICGSLLLAFSLDDMAERLEALLETVA